MSPDYRDLAPGSLLTAADELGDANFHGQWWCVPNSRIGTEVKEGERARRNAAVYSEIPPENHFYHDIQQRIKKAEEKPTNPKDAIGSGKLPLHLVPATGIAYEAMAFLEGGLKYGAHNYRAIGVRSSIYFDACRRHLDKWWNGEWADPVTGVPHLGSARACLNIILDAYLMEKLNDDRPPSNPALVKMIDDSSEDVARLKELFKDKNPTHYTINHKVG